MEFFRQGYWSGLAFASPRDLPDPEIKDFPMAQQVKNLLAMQESKNPIIHTVTTHMYTCICTRTYISKMYVR